MGRQKIVTYDYRKKFVTRSTVLQPIKIDLKEKLC